MCIVSVISLRKWLPICLTLCYIYEQGSTTYSSSKSAQVGLLSPSSNCIELHPLTVDDAVDKIHGKTALVGSKINVCLLLKEVKVYDKHLSQVIGSRWSQLLVDSHDLRRSLRTTMPRRSIQLTPGPTVVFYSKLIALVRSPYIETNVSSPALIVCISKCDHQVINISFKCRLRSIVNSKSTDQQY